MFCRVPFARNTNEKPETLQKAQKKFRIKQAGRNGSGTCRLQTGDSKKSIKSGPAETFRLPHLYSVRKEIHVKTAEEVVMAYEDLLYRAALTITGNRDDALDMVQETFIRWITKRPEFASDEHEKAWLLRVVMNLSRNLMNSAAHRTSCELLDIYPAENQEEENVIGEVMKLPEKLREVIYLYYYEEYNSREIAEILGENVSTVRTRLSRGRDMLKETLRETWETRNESL